VSIITLVPLPVNIKNSSSSSSDKLELLSSSGAEVSIVESELMESLVLNGLLTNVDVVHGIDISSLGWMGPLSSKC
jgi:hypothetical protein